MTVRSINTYNLKDNKNTLSIIIIKTDVSSVDSSIHGKGSSVLSPLTLRTLRSDPVDLDLGHKNW